MVRQFKVILTGLSNAGKTSILSVLDRQFHKLSGLVPTRGIIRSVSNVLKMNIIRWDLGGQEQYRKDYLSPESNALVESSLIIFVIDVQDEDTYDKAIEYYDNLLKVIKENDENPYFLICLHKVDPELYDKYKENVKDLMKSFKEKSKGWNHEIFVTSIFNRSSIIEAFSFGIAQFLPKKKALDLLLKNFMSDAKQTGEKVSGTWIWDENSIFLSMVFDDKKTEKNSVIASMGIIGIVESFEKEGEFRSLMLEINKEYQFLVIKVGKIYTAIVGKNVDFEKIWKLYDEQYLTNLEEIIEKEE
ncbi:MAG: 50S ribosome-binding GTPase [Candidatus Helarchaeota archaeon]|nr:50S ribosome-binding GTPase [Candidatus Helarchaeota archaeon]